MKRKKQYLITALSLIVLSGNLSCTKPGVSVQVEPTVIQKESVPFVHGSFNYKIKKIRRINAVDVQGGITVQGNGKDVKGNFVMSIDGDDMDMYIHANGIAAGSISLKGSMVDVTPSLDDEYMEYMFAVILRDSVKWWNIHEYDVVNTENYFLMRNSWKKVYVNALMLVPEKQVIRLTKQREVVISYGEIHDYGFGMFPSRIDFRYRGYRCVLLVERIEIKEMAMKSPGQGPLLPS
ncbi:MAG: hypothetical protein V3V59_07585 [Thermodesulfovibrionales bacterium]